MNKTITRTGSDPEILVILPTLGERLETLRLTLASIEEQRRQVNLHLVLVAPISASEARKIGKKFGATIVDDPKTGISDAINSGIAIRKTEKFYAWMGDDDIFRPNGLSTLKKLLDQNSNAVVSFGGCDYIDEKGRTLTTNRAGRLALFLLPWGPDLIPHPGSMIRIDALNSIGLFDSKLKYAMDLDAFLKLRKIGKFVWTKTAVSAFRWHPDSLTVSNRKKSSLESEAVKLKHLPSAAKPFRFFWQYPIRWASQLAAHSINSRARKL